ncbi:MAG: hypothetical protein H7Y18_19365 [Clostridiaceae bacterium]|nr:hypothetical protein [Clostridiaceae bacterium]
MLVDIGKENKNIFVSKAESLFDAARNLSLNSSFSFNYTQCRAVIFTTKAAIFELGDFLSELAQNRVLSSKGTVLRIDEFFNNRLLGSKVNLVDIIDLKKD